MSPLLRLTALCTAALAIAGCGGETSPADDAAGPSPFAPDGSVDTSGTVSNVATSHPDLPPIGGASECTIETADFAPASAAHVPTCAPLAYATRPPAGGPHYPYWAQFGAYGAPVPPGFLVHDEEHGAVVLAWSCPNGCPEVQAAFAAIDDALPDDPACAAPVRHRLVIVPDPTLDVPIAAAAWGHYYRATCLDQAGLAAWVSAHYAKAPEDTCAAGIDLHAQDGGVIDPCAADDAGAADAGEPDAAGDAADGADGPADGPADG